MDGTDRVRETLDGMGVSWRAPYGADSDVRTIFSRGQWAVHVDENPDGWYSVFAETDADTPEQAVEAVFGRATRRISTTRGAVGRCVCEDCGGRIEVSDRWCRHCGVRLTETVYESEEAEAHDAF